MSGKLYLPTVLHLLRVRSGRPCQQIHKEIFQHFCQQRFGRAPIPTFLKLPPRIPRLISWIYLTGNLSVQQEGAYRASYKD
jgi:hypothetical protein